MTGRALVQITIEGFISSLSAHRIQVHDDNMIMPLWRSLTFLKMLRLQWGTETLGVGVATKVWWKEKQRKSNKLLILQYTKNHMKFVKSTSWLVTNKNTSHQYATLIRAVRLGVKLNAAFSPACCFFRVRWCPYSVGLEVNSKSKCQQKPSIFLFILVNVRMKLYITLIFDGRSAVFVILGVFTSSVWISYDIKAVSVLMSTTATVKSETLFSSSPCKQIQLSPTLVFGVVPHDVLKDAVSGSWTTDDITCNNRWVTIQC